MNPREILMRLPIRILLIAGLWMPMLHSHAPELLEVARHGLTIETYEMEVGFVTRHTMETDHDHCPICALQIASPEIRTSGDDVFGSTVAAAEERATERASSLPIIHHAGRAPPRWV